jgi:hypothetical protein
MLVALRAEIVGVNSWLHVASYKLRVCRLWEPACDASAYHEWLEVGTWRSERERVASTERAEFFASDGHRENLFLVCKVTSRGC